MQRLFSRTNGTLTLGLVQGERQCHVPVFGRGAPHKAALLVHRLRAAEKTVDQHDQDLCLQSKR